MSNPISSSARYLTAFAVFAFFGFAVWIAERQIAARDPDLLWRDPTSGDDGLKFYRFDPVLGLFHKPDFTAEYGGIPYTLNSLGARNGELVYARLLGRSRWVVIGDSVVWGFGVPDGKTLCDALAYAMPGTDVVNLGVAGYGTGQELMLLQHEALRYEPDRVLLVFTLANDVEDSYYPDSADSFPANLFYLEDGALRVDRFELNPLERLGLWLAHNSYTVAWLEQRGAGARSAEDERAGNERGNGWRSATGRANRQRLEAHRPDLSHYARLSYLEPRASDRESVKYARRGGPLRPNALNHYKVELAKHLILEIERTSRAHGARLTVALAPYEAQLDSPGEDPLTAELARFLTAAEVEIVDLAPLLVAEMRRLEIPAERLYLDSVHFSPLGNRVVAGLLVAAVEGRSP